jgi:hypothetical protein
VLSSEDAAKMKNSEDEEAPTHPVLLAASKQEIVCSTPTQPPSPVPASMVPENQATFKQHLELYKNWHTLLANQNEKNEEANC